MRPVQEGSPRGEIFPIPTTAFQRRLIERERRFGIVPAEQLFTPEDRAAQYARLEAMVFSKPTDLEPVLAANNCTIWVKREFDRPTESHYDVATIRILQKLEEEGLLKPGYTILEGTSGSAGRSFAYFCKRLGFHVDLISPRELATEALIKGGRTHEASRLRDMAALGANLILSDQAGGIGKVMRKWQAMQVNFRNQGYEEEVHYRWGKPIRIFRGSGKVIVAPNHSEITITPEAFEHIGNEIVAQLPQDVRIATFVSALGNGSTTKGIAKILRNAFGTSVVGVEPREAPMNATKKIREQIKRENPGITPDELKRRVARTFYNVYQFPLPNTFTYHTAYGMSTPGIEPPFVEVDTIDEIRLLRGDPGVRAEWRDLKRRHNLYAWLNNNVTNAIGNTSAMCLLLAHKLAEDPKNANKNFLIIFYDKGDQYDDWPPFVPLEQSFETMCEYVMRTTPQHQAA